MEEAWQARAAQGEAFGATVREAETIARLQVIDYARDGCRFSAHFGLIAAHTALQNIESELGWSVSNYDAKRWRSINTADLHHNPRLLDEYLGNKIGIIYNGNRGRNADPYERWLKLVRVEAVLGSTYIHVSDPHITGRMNQIYNIRNLGPRIIATDTVEHIPSGNAPDGWQSRYLASKAKPVVFPVAGPHEATSDILCPDARFLHIHPLIERWAGEAGRAARTAAERTAFSINDPDLAAQKLHDLKYSIGGYNALQDVENMRPYDPFALPALVDRDV